MGVSYARCRVYDLDGTLVGEEKHNEIGDGKPRMLISSTNNRIPKRIAADCERWMNHVDRHTNPDLAGSCLWWIREYEQLLRATQDSRRQGVVRNDPEHQMYNQLMGGSATTNTTARCDTMWNKRNNRALICKVSERRSEQALRKTRNIYEQLLKLTLFNSITFVRFSHTRRGAGYIIRDVHDERADEDSKW